MLVPIQTASNHPEEMVREMYKCEHIFRSLGLSFEFGLCEESKMPVLINTALDFPSEYLCFFSSDPYSRNLDPIRLSFDLIAHRVLNRWEYLPESGEFNGLQMLAAETVAHEIRYKAMLEPDAVKRRQMCTVAFNIYEFVLLCFRHGGIRHVLQNKDAMRAKPMTFNPVSDLHAYEECFRRGISHCFAGMAMCALVGERSPLLFLGLASAALSWNSEKSLELGALLRVWLLMVGTYNLKLSSVSVPGKRAGESWMFSAESFETVEELMGLTSSTMINLPGVYDLVTKNLVLPLVLRSYYLSSLLEFIT